MSLPKSVTNWIAFQEQANEFDYHRIEGGLSEAQALKEMGLKEMPQELAELIQSPSEVAMARKSKAFESELNAIAETQGVNSAAYSELKAKYLAHLNK